MPPRRPERELKEECLAPGYWKIDRFEVRCPAVHRGTSSRWLVTDPTKPKPKDHIGWRKNLGEARAWIRQMLDAEETVQITGDAL
jgi:hypothetical protein